MNKFLLMLPIMVLLVACKIPTADNRGSSMSGDIAFTNICIDGVTYVTRHLDYKYGVMAVKLDKNTKIVPCVNRTPVGE